MSTCRKIDAKITQGLRFVRKYWRQILVLILLALVAKGAWAQQNPLGLSPQNPMYVGGEVPKNAGAPACRALPELKKGVLQLAWHEFARSRSAMAVLRSPDGCEFLLVRTRCETQWMAVDMVCPVEANVE
jgi:hypothetical protein